MYQTHFCWENSQGSPGSWALHSTEEGRQTKTKISISFVRWQTKVEKSKAGKGQDNRVGQWSGKPIIKRIDYT